jgi:UDP-3-O-[3-hydroxymyristoyl] glucosamine N-acyltransferase
LEGDSDRVIRDTAPLASARTGDLTFYDGRQERDLLERTAAAGVLVPHNHDAHGLATTLLRCDGPQRALRVVTRELWERRNAPHGGVAGSATVDPRARVASGAHIHEHATVSAHAELAAGCVLHPGVLIGEGAAVGARTILGANAVIEPGVRIGADCVIHPGAVIGFCYRPSPPDAPLSQAPSYGGVLIEDGVEIGPHSVVESGETVPTVIGRGAKLGAQVVIGHDCQIGAHAHLVAMVGLAGGVRVGADAVLFGQVGVAGDVQIGERAVIYGKSGVAGDVPAEGRYFGYPARPRDEAISLLSGIAALRDLSHRIERLERSLGPD